jgi:hypothetical protein
MRDGCYRGTRQEIGDEHCIQIQPQEDARMTKLQREPCAFPIKDSSCRHLYIVVFDVLTETTRIMRNFILGVLTDEIHQTFRRNICNIF